MVEGCCVSLGLEIGLVIIMDVFFEVMFECGVSGVSWG